MILHLYVHLWSSLLCYCYYRVAHGTLLEDCAVRFAKQWHDGFGLHNVHVCVLGDQDAKSIHARFNSLQSYV